MITPRKLQANESNEYFKRYINLVETQDIVAALKNQLTDIEQFFRAWPRNKWNHTYAEGKWTIKELVQHIIDAERVLSYRALRFSRNDATNVPGFDEDWYVAYSNGNDRDFKDILQEFTHLRNATISLISLLFRLRSLTSSSN